jgi:S1-C subfamily serine protease
MKPFDSKWDRFAPFVIGALFGLCAAMLAVSIVMFRRAEERGLSRSLDGDRAGSPSAGEERSQAIVEATRLASPAVVSVTAILTKDVTSNPYLYYQFLQQYYFNPSFQARLRDGRPVIEYTSFGSGVVLAPQGYVLTNEHVIRDAERIYVTMNDGTQTEASLIGAAASYDLALLKIDGKNLPYARFGDSDRLSIGEWVIAIGNPFGYLLDDPQPSVTVGVVSALHRDVRAPSTVFNNMIQTDAAINPGNSGGPLVSGAGEVVGINTFIFSTQEGSIPGMSFAIPINTAKMVIDEITHYGRVRGTWTGISVIELTPEEARRRGLDVDHGLYVDRVDPGQPGERAGIRRGDVILRVNGMAVRTQQQSARAIFGLKVGDETEIIVRRGGRDETLRLRLGERPLGA